MIKRLHIYIYIQETENEKNLKIKENVRMVARLLRPEEHAGVYQMLKDL